MILTEKFELSFKMPEEHYEAERFLKENPKWIISATSNWITFTKQVRLTTEKQGHNLKDGE